MGMFWYVCLWIAVLQITSFPIFHLNSRNGFYHLSIERNFMSDWWTCIVLRLLFEQLKVIVTVQWMFIKFISNMPKSINLFYCLWLIIMTVLFYLWLIIVYFFVTVPYRWPLWYGPTLLFPWVPLISNAKRQPRNQHDDPEKRCLYCGK